MFRWASLLVPVAAELDAARESVVRLGAELERAMSSAMSIWPPSTPR